MSLTVTPLLQWLRMPSKSTQYISRAPTRRFDAQRRLIQDAVNEADFYVDFSPYQLIYVVSPAGSGIDYSPGFTPNSPFFGVKADGNNFTHGATLGNDFYVSDFYGANVPSTRPRTRSACPTSTTSTAPSSRTAPSWATGT